MHEPIRDICFLGAGAIGTSLGNVLAEKVGLNVSLLSIEKDVVDSINTFHVNYKYFPSLRLEPHLTATTEPKILRKADVIFVAIPSSAVATYVLSIQKHIGENAVIVNLAKGFAGKNTFITECMGGLLNNPVCALKGPTFARELINGIPSAFTLASKEIKHYNLLGDIFAGTNVYIDYSNDVKGVEILSILKNIYAIALGIVDANFNSPNLRFMILTKAFNEIRKILVHFGGKQDTMFNYCGIGDFTLTALNDLSRNRTLGLLIGKGFFTENISDKMVLEGKIAVEIFCDEFMKEHENMEESYPIMAELYKIFTTEYNVSEFVNRMLRV